MKVLAKNRKARYEYEVIETFEAGIVLVGTEVKSCRAGQVSLVDSYARMQDGELWLLGAHIAPYNQGNRNNHEAVHPRKLLLHKREIQRLGSSVDAKGLTVVPTRIYLNPRSKIKVELGLCRGKNVRDKRDDIKRRVQDREVQQAIAARR